MCMCDVCVHMCAHACEPHDVFAEMRGHISEVDSLIPAREHQVSNLSGSGTRAFTHLAVSLSAINFYVDLTSFKTTWPRSIHLRIL